MAKFKIVKIHSCDRCKKQWAGEGVYGIDVNMLGLFNIQICEFCILSARDEIAKRRNVQVEQSHT